MFDRIKTLEQLKSISGLKIGELVKTYDIGMQFSYATKEGCGIDCGYNIGDWPVHRITDSKLQEKWETLIEKISNENLTHEDLKDTVLEILTNAIEAHYGTFPIVQNSLTKRILTLPQFYKPLLSLSKDEANDFFLIIDCGKWELDDLEVYKCFNNAVNAFSEKYCWISPWENLDDDELEDWQQRLKEDFGELSYYTYEESENSKPTI